MVLVADNYKGFVPFNSSLFRLCQETKASGGTPRTRSHLLDGDKGNGGQLIWAVLKVER